MPGIVAPEPVAIPEDDFSDLWTPSADSAATSLTGPEAVYSALQANAPELLIPIGMAHTCQSAQVTSTSGKDMTATFTILTRPKKNELNRGGRMVQIAPGPLGQGMKTENYQNNPVVLFNHGMEGFVFPLGLCQDKGGKISLKCNPRQMSGTVYFKQSCPYAENIFQMVDDGLIRMSSAGFAVEQLIPLEIDTSRGPQGVQFTNKYGYDCTQSDLIEWSVVVTGADAGALRQCVETGKWKGHLIRPQLLPVLRQYAERPEAWGIGFGPGTIHQQAAAEFEAGRLTQAEIDELRRTKQFLPQGEPDWMGEFRKSVADSRAEVAQLRQHFTDVTSTITANFSNQQSQVTNPPITPAAPQQPQLQPVTPVVQQFDVSQIVQQIGPTITNAVAAAVREVQEAQTKLTGRIDQLTGKLPK